MNGASRVPVPPEVEPVHKRKAVPPTPRREKRVSRRLDVKTPAKKCGEKRLETCTRVVLCELEPAGEGGEGDGEHCPEASEGLPPEDDGLGDSLALTPHEESCASVDFTFEAGSQRRAILCVGP